MTYELRIVQGPLPDPLRAQVMAGWGRYDPRLLDEVEWRDEFERAPAGPAVHALVVSGDERVIGHHCAIPVRLLRDGGPVLFGKGEAIYVDTGDDRGARVRLGERDVRPVQALTRGLYESYQRFGLAGYFGYATPAAERRHVEAGCRVVELPYERHFLFHRPAEAAARSRFGDRPLRRAALSLALRVPRTLARLRLRHGGGSVEAEEVEAFPPSLDVRFAGAADPDTYAFEPSAAQLDWRFARPPYRRFLLGSPPWGYVVLSGPDESGRRRVVDWLVPIEHRDAVPAVARLLLEASADAVGLEWIVPVSSPSGRAVSAALSRSPLVRDPRRRAFRMVVHGPDDAADANRWTLTLATQERF